MSSVVRLKKEKVGQQKDKHSIVFKINNEIKITVFSHIVVEEKYTKCLDAVVYSMFSANNTKFKYHIYYSTTTYDHTGTIIFVVEHVRCI